jgi:uncharacterized protein YndB with AHSA1/START domain
MSETPATRQVTINALPQKVWRALTDVSLMPQWMSETEMEVTADWHVGHSITIQGRWHKMKYKNTGVVLQFDVDRTLSYSHLSSLSRLPDVPENHSIITFRLEPVGSQTAVTVILSNSPDYTIQKHLEFYWTVTLGLLKQFAERL